jgi:hypothetical protein
MNRARRAAVTALVAVAVAVGVAIGATGRTGSPRVHATSTPSPGTTSAAALGKWLRKGGMMPNEKPVAEARGTILNAMTGASVPVQASVLSVTVGRSTTELVWRLSSTDDSRNALNSVQLSQVPWEDTRLVGLEVPATRTTYHPYTMVPPKAVNGVASECMCSDLQILELSGTGTLMYATMPRLDAQVTSVTVTMPGFPDMPNVPVRRATGRG